MSKPKTSNDITGNSGYGRVFVLSAPSGAGKSTLAQAAIASTPELVRSVTYTTRPPRLGVFHLVRAGAHQHAELLVEFLGLVLAVKMFWQDVDARADHLLRAAVDLRERLGRGLVDADGDCLPGTIASVA